jgi:hypothetical protein
MKSVYYLVLIAVLLVSCSTALSGGAIQTAIAQTQIAQPTNTLVPIPTATLEPTITPAPTQIMLADLDLESILIQPGDLPAGYTGALISKSLSDLFEGVHQSINQAYQQFEQNGRYAGGVDVAIFSKQTDPNDVYEIVGWSDGKSVPNLGEKSEVEIDAFLLGGVVNLKFIRCSAVVNIQFYNTTDFESVIAYAQRLDERLTPLVCR